MNDKYRIIAGPCKRCGRKEAKKVEVCDGGSVTLCDECREGLEKGKFTVRYEKTEVKYSTRALGICVAPGGRYVFDDVP